MTSTSGTIATAQPRERLVVQRRPQRSPGLEIFCQHRGKLCLLAPFLISALADAARPTMGHGALRHAAGHETRRFSNCPLPFCGPRSRLRMSSVGTAHGSGTSCGLKRRDYIYNAAKSICLLMSSVRCTGGNGYLRPVAQLNSTARSWRPMRPSARLCL